MLLAASQRLRFPAKNTSPQDLQIWIVHLSNELIHHNGVIPQKGTGTAVDVLGKSLEDLGKELDAVCDHATDRMQSLRRPNSGGASYLYNLGNPIFMEA